MFPPIFYVGIAGLFAGLIASRVLCERAVRLLSAQEKLTLLDNFSRLRAYGAIPLLLVAGIFFAIASLPESIMLPLYFGGWALLAGYIAWQSLYVHKRLRELGISEAYRAAFTRAQWCSRAGFIALFACMTGVILR
jgi:hypothetical protein